MRRIFLYLITNIISLVSFFYLFLSQENSCRSSFFIASAIVRLFTSSVRYIRFDINCLDGSRGLETIVFVFSDKICRNENVGSLFRCFKILLCWNVSVCASTASWVTSAFSLPNPHFMLTYFRRSS